jgi:hypothetical protein
MALLSGESLTILDPHGLKIIPSIGRIEQRVTNVSDRQDVIEDVRRAEKARQTALLAADSGRLESMLADEYVYVHASGRVETREDYLNAVKSGGFRFIDFTSQNVIVTPYGDATLAAGEIIVLREEAQVRKRSHFRFASLWTRAQDGWKLAFWQNTTKA